MVKIESPFVRETINGVYVVTPKIAEGYEWVFNDNKVLALEKLHGTNVSIVIENKAITSIYNRTEKIPFFNKGKKFIIESLLESHERGYIQKLGDGQHFGETIGEKVNGNPYHLKGHLWIPFNTYAREKLAYKSWGKYPKDFDSISKWFQTDLFSLFIRKVHDGKIEFPEGIVFVHPETGKMAKLRRDMYSFYYKDNPNAKPHKG